MQGFGLRPERDVLEGPDGRLIAESPEPWLSFKGFEDRWRDRFIEIVYRSSWLDEPARPVFRFWQNDGSFIDRIGAAAILGSGIWVGRVPATTVSMSISPTNRLGRFDFKVERVSSPAWLSFVSSAFRRRPSYAWRALALRIIGCRAESDAMLDWSLSATDFNDFSSWRRRRHRPFDETGMDHPRCDWPRQRVIFVVNPSRDAKGEERTRASLRSQIFDGWSVLLLSSEADDGAASDPRFERAGTQDVLNHSKGWGENFLICVLTAGDSLVPEALAFVVEQADRHPGIDIFYGDMLVHGDDGAEMPVLFPPWSSRRVDGIGYPVFVRMRALRSDASCAAFLSSFRLPEAVLSGGAKAIHRILATTAQGSPHPKSQTIPPSDLAEVAPRKTAASIIIPTCAKPDLLERLLASILAGSTQSLAEILIVDNGTPPGRLDDVVREYGSKTKISVLEYREPFNFSAVCNLGASVSLGDVVVFLNDDMEVASGDWLDRLVTHAVAADVGAVGAKLIYPDGRLQHVGMVVGMGESAGHFGAREPGDSPGWMRRNETVHEIGAVTGACLAVERRKLEQVGGFDTLHYPIELGDVDLCLRLSEMGWSTLLDPHVRLMHYESKSRGRATFRRLSVHAEERRHFRERWRHVLRDDPHFHPGLSLYDWGPALG